MYSTSSILCSLILSTYSSPLSTETKASSPFTNCGCQCSSLTFRDSAGVIQGNCATIDSTGAQWCYVDSDSLSSCQDLVPSQRFPHNPWSYEACATPAVGSPLCPNYQAYPPHNIHHHLHPIVPNQGPVVPHPAPALPVGPAVATGPLPVAGGPLPLGPSVGNGPLPVTGGPRPLGPNLGNGPLPVAGGPLPLGPAVGVGGPVLPGLGDARQ